MILWIYDTQRCKISCPNSTSFMRYKNNKFQAIRLFRWFIRHLLFLYLTNEVKFGQDIQGCVSSYHLHVWFLVNLDIFFWTRYTSSGGGDGRCGGQWRWGAGGAAEVEMEMGCGGWGGGDGDGVRMRCLARVVRDLRPPCDTFTRIPFRVPLLLMVVKLKLG
jgi:hypothetical protein